MSGSATLLDRSSGAPGALPSVSVVVPTRNRRASLSRVLPPILADPATAELVVVVDGDAASFELLRGWAVEDERLKPLLVPHGGQAAAREAGARAASGEVLLFLDDDTLPAPRLVEGHARHHVGETGLVVLGYAPTVTPAPRKPGDVATFLYAREYERSWSRLEREQGAVLRNLWGANLSIRRADALRIGLRSPLSELYHEDRDFGLRCLEAGLRGRVDRSLVVWHLHTRPLAAFLADARKQGAGRRLLHERHPKVLGPMPARAFEEGLPRPARWLVRSTRQPLARRVLSGLLGVVTRAAGRAHLFPAETAGAKLLRRIEQQHGSLTGQVARRPGRAARPRTWP
jgi:glycosyltransferase involved in cell wall biosynthesis